MLPWLGWLLALLAGILAVREAMDFETDKALATVFVSWLIAAVIRPIFWLLF